jgi:hypothetical protein
MRLLSLERPVEGRNAVSAKLLAFTTPKETFYDYPTDICKYCIHASNT